MNSSALSVRCDVLLSAATFNGTQMTFLMRNNDMKTLMHNYSNQTEISLHRLLKAVTLIVAIILSSTPHGTRADSRGPNLKKDLSNSDVAPKNLTGPSSKSNESQTKLQLSEAYRRLPLSFEAN